MITNDIFSNEEKRLLDFILKPDFKNKTETINYINSLSAEHIVRDYSPYYKIIEFRSPNIQNGYSGMSDMITVLTIRKDGIPTVFTLYAKDGFPFEYEIYNADGSAMDMNLILEGELRRIFIMNTMIKTERLTLAPLCENDRDALVAIFRDDIVKATYMLPDLDDDGKADKMFSRLLSISRADEHFLLGIYYNHTLIGIINDVGTEDKTIELGYAISSAYHNRGFMTEALLACIPHLKALGFSTIRCGAFDGNLASFRVMEKCGMKKIDYTETIDYREKNHTCIFYEI